MFTAERKRIMAAVFLAVVCLSLAVPTGSVLVTAATTPTETATIEGGYSSLSTETFKGTFNVTTIIGPDNAWAALEPLLQSAKHTIYVEIFGVNDRDILNELWDIKTHNTSIDMKIMIGTDSFGYQPANDYVAYNLSTALEVPFKWTSKQWTYTHAKFIMIDNETVIIQSGNWAKTSFPNRTLNEIGNREWSVAIHSSTVTQYYLDVFSLDWSNGFDYNETRDGTGTPITALSSYHSSSAEHPFNTTGSFNEYMEITPVFSNDTSLSAILELINSANTSLDIQIPYFTNYQDGGAMDDVINAINAAADRGVAVRIITEEGSYDNDLMADVFANHSIPVVWFKETWFTALHNKGIIVDGTTTYISSVNFSDTSIEENREAGVIIKCVNLTSYYQAVFEYDWNRGEIANTVIQLTQNPTTVGSGVQVQVNASFYEFENITTATLSYSVNGSAWTNVSMSDLTVSTLQVWTGIIPGQTTGTTVQYKVYAQDILNNTFVSQTRSYTVGVEPDNGDGETSGLDPMTVMIISIIAVIAVAVVGFFTKSKSKRR